MSRLQNILKSKYFIILAIAGIWIVFFDNYNLRAQYKMAQRIEQLESDRQHYQQKIKELDFEREQLFTNSDELERFARETYFMKKRGEEIFIITE